MSRGRPKGGPKIGGRKKGTPNKKTRETLKKVEETGLTPLQIMIEGMRFFYKKFLDQEKESLLKDDYLKTATNIAKDAAPYLHPKLSTIEVGNKDGKPFEHSVSITIEPVKPRS